jgi:hypothetical protein
MTIDTLDTDRDLTPVDWRLAQEHQGLGGNVEPSGLENGMFQELEVQPEDMETQNSSATYVEGLYSSKLVTCVKKIPRNIAFISFWISVPLPYNEVHFHPLLLLLFT